MVKHERPGAERRRILTWQRWIGAEEYPGVVWVNGAPHLHHDHIATLGLVDAVEASSLVIRFVQACVVLALPPAIRTLAVPL